MSGYNFNHFTGKTKGKTSRKKKIRMKQNHKNKYEKYSNNRKVVSNLQQMIQVQKKGGSRWKDITIQNIAEKD